MLGSGTRRGSRARRGGGGRQNDGRRARTRSPGAPRAARERRRPGSGARRPHARPREEGMQATVPLQARKGRASYLGARSVGHQDPGRDLDGADHRRAGTLGHGQAMSEQVLLGLGAAAGVGLGRVAGCATAPAEEERSGGAERAAGERSTQRRSPRSSPERAENYALAGLGTEAEISRRTNSMAEDPTLLDEVTSSPRRGPRPLRVRSATERTRGARSDLRPYARGSRSGRAPAGAPGRPAARGAPARARPARTILVARDLGPAEVAELRSAGDMCAASR